MGATGQESWKAVRSLRIVATGANYLAKTGQVFLRVSLNSAMFVFGKNWTSKTGIMFYNSIHISKNTVLVPVIVNNNNIRNTENRMNNFCTHCGTRLLENALFCPQCRTRVAAATQANEVPGNEASG